jgi:hypothetical protein
MEVFQMSNGGPAQWGKLYDRQVWRGPRGLRKVVLARDPVCCICHRAASTVADHKIPHRGVWSLFVDLSNLWGLCDTCHSRKTSAEDGGFSHPIQPKKENSGTKPTGGAGKQFSSSSLKAEKLDSACDFDVSSLLEGIPK